MQRRSQALEWELRKLEQIRRRPELPRPDHQRDVDRDRRMENIEIEVRRQPPVRRRDIDRPAPNDRRRGVEERLEQMEQRFDRLENMMRGLIEQPSDHE